MKLSGRKKRAIGNWSSREWLGLASWRLLWTAGYLLPGSILICLEKSAIYNFIGNLCLKTLPLINILKIQYQESLQILELYPAHESPLFNAQYLLIAIKLPRQALCARCCSRHLTHFICTATLGDRYYYKPSFSSEGSETPSCLITHQGHTDSKSWS